MEYAYRSIALYISAYVVFLDAEKIYVTLLIWASQISYTIMFAQVYIDKQFHSHKEYDSHFHWTCPRIILVLRGDCA